MLRVVTFNIFYALRSERLLKTALSAFGDLEPDIVALQEVWQSKKRRFTQALAYALGYDHHFVPRATILGRSIGMAILTKLPLAVTEHIVLPPARSRLRPRIAHYVEVATSHGCAGLTHTHLESLATKKTRAKQLERIFESLEARPIAQPQILMGDFNTYSKREIHGVTETLNGNGFSVAEGLPYSWKHLGFGRNLDWIAAKNCRIHASGVLEDVSGSDHKPVWADIAF